LDITEERAVTALIERVDPDVIIHAAAMTDVDACENHQNRAERVNVDGTRAVVSGGERVDANLIFVSTSFVFDGSSPKYYPSDSRCPVNSYGETKAEAERIVETSNLNTGIVRTDQPYGTTQPWQTPTMVQWTIDKLEGASSVPVFEDWYNCPTYLPDLATFLITLAERPLTGIYHTVGPDYLNRYEWARNIAEVFGYDRSRVVPVTAKGDTVAAERPNVWLVNDERTDSLDMTFRPVEGGLKALSEVIETVSN
jgi:dTDP-4-dehydrorhamnose reductase